MAATDLRRQFRAENSQLLSFWRANVRREVSTDGGSPGPVNVRETAGFCIYCSDPTLLTRVRPTGLVRGYGS
jgi:hypothetical protein